MDILTFGFYKEYLVVRYASGNFKINIYFTWSFPDYCVSGTKCLQQFIFADWRFCFVLRELILAIRTDWFFLLGINFSVFQKVASIQH